MAKLYVVLAIALVIESFGNIYITKGMKELGEVEVTKLSSITSTIRRGATNVHLLLGVAMLAGFFGLFLAMLSWADVTVVLPLTSIGYVTTAIFAKWMLGEDVNVWRWIGTLLIVVGVYFVQKSNSSQPASGSPASQPAVNNPA
jgi:drug/metabolite transporter (DMT)-like permease